MLDVLKTKLDPWIQRLVAKASRSYLSGETLNDALRTNESLQKLGYSVTIAYWDREGEAPLDVLSHYLKEVEGISKNPSENYVSIKAPSLKFDPDHYAPLLKKAREMGVQIHFDSLDHKDVDVTRSLIDNHTPQPCNDIGFTLPGRWQRSIEDADWVSSMGLNVRIVKGQWPDPDYPSKDMSEGFIEVIQQLAGKAHNVRIASHDPPLVRKSIEILQQANTRCELELLYGLPIRDVLPIAKEMGVPVRFYVPYGFAWLPYSLNLLKNKPRVLWWLLKDSFSGPYVKQVEKYALGD